ncbi:MAG: DUF4290 domain-containing protein [Cyclobacteriaceae bacterium]
MALQYNAENSMVILKEYGRNVQNLAEHIVSIEDRDKRTRYAYTLIELMRQLNPSVRENDETTQKLWDDLFIMTNFSLDVDAPYPKPDVDVLTKKPKRLSYSTQDVTYKHYGKNIEKLIEQATELEDEAERKGAIVYIGKLMKNFYQTWNRENVDDEVILSNIRQLSRGKLTLSIEEVKSNNLFDFQKSRGGSSSSSGGGSKGGRRNQGSNNRRKK